MQPEARLILALWRRGDDGKPEFFVPEGHRYEALSHPLTGDPGATARQIVSDLFGLESRGNIKIFRRRGGCVTAFGLTTAEAGRLSPQGRWRPVSLIEDIGTALALQDVVHDL